MPFEQVDHPSQQDRGAFVDFQHDDGRQRLLVLAEDGEALLNEGRLDLGRIHEHQF